MDFQLNADQLSYQQSARAFAEGQLKPGAARWDAEHHFPKDVLARAGDMGFMAMYTPVAAGGMGLTRLDASVIVEELARGCTSTAAYITIHNMATNMLARYGSADVVQAWCPSLVAGEKLASYCLTEPEAGSDAASLRTTARRDGDHYVVSGSKMFISGAGDTDLLIVMVRTGAAGASGISALAIPADLSGIHYGKREIKMGWNSQPTRAITFDQVRVPLVNRLGEEGQGFKIAMEGLDGGRINIATCSLGTAQAALEEVVSYTQSRRQFGRAIADFQVTQFKLADMATELVAARQLVRLAAFKLDRLDSEATVYCAMAKRFATDVCFAICNEALQLHGGYGYIREYPVERHVRDARVHQILEGTNEIMRVIIARRLLLEHALEIIR